MVFVRINEDKKLARNVVLEYIKNRVNAYNDDDFFEHEISMEDVSLNSFELADAMSNIVHDDGSELTVEEKQDYIELLKQDEHFDFEDGDLRVAKIPLDFILKQKYNIAIDTIKDNIAEIAMAAGAIVVVSSVVIGGVYLGDSQLEKREKYQNSVLVSDERDYLMKDIYVVYDVDNTHFCTRKIQKITEDDKIYGSFRRGYGIVDEYYYRDEIYDYYDIKTDEKVCCDHEDGFYIEGLMDFYDMNKMSDKNYRISLDEVSNDIDNENLLSRDASLKRK